MNGLLAFRLRIARAMTYGLATLADRAALQSALAQPGVRTIDDLPSAVRQTLARLESRGYKDQVAGPEVKAAAGVDIHPGGEQLKPDPSIVEMLDMVQAAAGHDVTPGHDELHHYWTRDPEGLAKWADSPKPWTTLVAHLAPKVGLAKAKVFASRWFIEAFGYASGSDKNRVAHGHPPRGHRVGPG